MATINRVGNGLSGTSGTVNFVGSTSSTLITPTLGSAFAASINFGGTALANYTQGTWVPTFTFQTAGNLSVVYSTQSGTYTRVGRILFINFTLICTPTFTTSSGFAQIAGLPFAAAVSNCAGEIGLEGANDSFAAGYTFINPATTATLTRLTILKFGSAKAHNAISTTSITSGVQVSFGGSINFHV